MSLIDRRHIVETCSQIDKGDPREKGSRFAKGGTNEAQSIAGQLFVRHHVAFDRMVTNFKNGNPGQEVLGTEYGISRHIERREGGFCVDDKV